MKVNTENALKEIRKLYSPKIISELNDHYIKVVKVKGNRVPWHIHDNSDELFLILEGALTIRLRNENSFVLSKNDLYVIRKGVEHRVEAEEECSILLIELKDTLHTGNVSSAISRSIEEQL